MQQSKIIIIATKILVKVIIMYRCLLQYECKGKKCIILDTNDGCEEEEEDYRGDDNESDDNYSENNSEHDFYG